MQARTLIVGGTLVLVALVGLTVLVIPFVGGWFALPMVVGIGVVGLTAGLASIPLAMLTSRPALRPGAVGAMAFLAFEAVTLIVGMTGVGGPHFSEGMLAASIFFVAPALLAIASLFVVPWRPSRAAAVLGLAMAAVATLFSAHPFMPGGSTGRGDEWFSFVVGQATASAGLFMLAVLGRRAEERWWDGAVMALVPAAALATTIAWIGMDRTARVDDLRIMASVTALLWPLAAAVSLGRLMRLARLRNLLAWLPIAFVLATAAGGVLLAWSALKEDETCAALGAAAFVLAGAIGVAVVLLGWLHRRMDVAERMTAIEPGAITCPRCREAIELRPGAGACAACGLRYRLSIEAPRCRRCGQDLSPMAVSACPECGEAVRLAPAAEAGAASAVTGADGACS